MKRSLVFAFGAFAALATLSPAFADEPPPVKRAPARVAPRAAEPVRQAAAPAAPANNWTGSQVGASNGGSFANNAFVDPGSYICPPGIAFGLGCFETPFTFKGSPASYTVGPFLGYRVQAGSIVVGVEGDFSYKNAQTSQHLSATTSYPDFTRVETFTGSLKQTWDGSIRGRVGYLVTPWTLVYATGGLAIGQVSGSFSYSGTIYDADSVPVATAVATRTFSDTRLGVTIGGGVEYQLWGPWTARLEYRYTDFGKFYKTVPVINSTLDPTVVIPNPSPGASVQLHPSFQTVRLGLALNF